MNQPARSSTDSPATAADNVFEAILADIVRGVYPSKSRLPAERELARLLGASRPTIREALSRLGEWCLVEARRGSGVVVREQRDWSIDVLPAFLRYAGAAIPPAHLARMIRDLLALRRGITVDCVALVADRLAGADFGPSRAALRMAWERRDDPAGFTEADLALMRGVIELADFMPGVWLLNRMKGVYLEIARALSGGIAPPPDYPLALERVFESLEDGRGNDAVRILRDYLEYHDQRMLTALGANP